MVFSLSNNITLLILVGYENIHTVLALNFDSLNVLSEEIYVTLTFVTGTFVTAPKN